MDQKSTNILKKKINAPKIREMAATVSGFKPPMPQPWRSINNAIFNQVVSPEVRLHDQMFCLSFKMARRLLIHL